MAFYIEINSGGNITLKLCMLAYYDVKIHKL